MGLSAAGVGQEPGPGPTDVLGLRPERSPRSPEGGAEGGHAEEAQEARTVTSDLGQAAGSVSQLVGGEVGGGGSRPLDQVGDSQTQRQQRLLLEGGDDLAGEAGRPEHVPEAVARVGEVVPHRPRIQTGIDTAEELPQPRCDHVGHRSTLGRRQLLPGRASHCHRVEDARFSALVAGAARGRVG